MTFENVTLVAHADWSINPQKRWMAFASRSYDHSWWISGPMLVGEPSDLFFRLSAMQNQPGSILTGFDFPIGLPVKYCEQAGITDFLSALPLFGNGNWEDFYHPAVISSEINIFRPFYPMKSGKFTPGELERGLGIPFHYLYRLCEKAHINRRAACPLFWTLGPQQVGKAAISGWKSIVSPGLADSNTNLKIWPFSGSMSQICQSENIIITETYPAEYYSPLGLFSSLKRLSKRNQYDRSQFADILFRSAQALHMELDAYTIALIKDGFDKHLWGEDQFDALVGLYGMINIVDGYLPFLEPISNQVVKLEGWIFSQQLSEGAS